MAALMPAWRIATRRTDFVGRMKSDIAGADSRSLPELPGARRPPSINTDVSNHLGS